MALTPSFPHQADLHTHTFRCQHATGDARDYAAVASERGVTLLGISDHTPMPDGRWPGARMAMNELPDYSHAVDKARRAFPDMTILKGLEAEFADDLVGFYQDQILGRRGFDYLVGGIHMFRHQGGWQSTHGEIETPEELASYTDFFIRSMRSGLFLFMAHPDLFGLTYPQWDQQAQSCSHALCAAACDLQIPLEINANGLRIHPTGQPDPSHPTRAPYPWTPFWEIAQRYPLRILVSSDAHHPQALNDPALQQATTLALSLFPQADTYAWLNKIPKT